MNTPEYDALDTTLKHIATKSWVLGSVIGGMVVAAGLAIAIVRLF